MMAESMPLSQVDAEEPPTLRRKPPTGSILERQIIGQRALVARNKLSKELLPPFGAIYFISAAFDYEAPEHVKIGFSYDPMRRLNDLRPASPMDLQLEGWVLGTESDEEEFQNRLGWYLHDGEWFVLSEPVQRVIRTLLEFERERIKLLPDVPLTGHCTGIRLYLTASAEQQTHFPAARLRVRGTS